MNGEIFIERVDGKVTSVRVRCSLISGKLNVQMNGEDMGEIDGLFFDLVWPSFPPDVKIKNDWGDWGDWE